jgi:EAL domain-containing protein (putative c-di-GMP-specific phosphodiesterase class I)
MPGLGGKAILEAIRAVIPPGSFVPIVVLTADTTFEARQEALAAGAKDFLTKPFEHVEVLLRVNNLLETRAMHLALENRNAALETELHEEREQSRRSAEEQAQRVRTIRQIIDNHELGTVFQPISDLVAGTVIGVEALSRFTSPTSRTPDYWFSEAAAVGLGIELELLAINTALSHLVELPRRFYVAINVGPVTACDSRLVTVLEPFAERLVVELTEHEAIGDYEGLTRAFAALHQLGARVAVDDTGSGYSSLQHILQLRPDVLKLDIALTRGIATDPARRALAAGLLHFAEEIGATVVAEGIETPADLDAIRQIGVGYGQGFHLGRPEPASAFGD